jgi:hypothetical protein
MLCCPGSFGAHTHYLFQQRIFGELRSSVMFEEERMSEIRSGLYTHPQKNTTTTTSEHVVSLFHFFKLHTPSLRQHVSPSKC